MTLVQLRYLVAVDTWRNFRKAAAECGVAQPSLSAQLNRLERELGIRLIDRSTKPVTPTSEGERIIKQARTILAEVDKLTPGFDETTTARTQQVRVGVEPGLATTLMPLILPGLAQRYPETQFTFVEKHTLDLVDALKRENVDVGLTTTSPEVRGIRSRVLFNEPFVGYVSSKHRLFAQPTLRREDLTPDDLWLPADKHLLAVLDIAPATQAPVQYTSPNTETLKRLVERGEGMAVLPLLAVRTPAAFKPEHVRTFSDNVPTRPVYALHPNKPLQPERLETIVALVQQAVGTLGVQLAPSHE